MNKNQKELIKIYIALFILIYVAINWDSVSWIFNYREISGLAYDFFNPYQENDIVANAQNVAIMSNATITTGATTVVNQPDPSYTNNVNSLEIPAIGIVTPVLIGESTDIPTLERDLDKGAVYYPGSVQPGSNGQMIILGHSAPLNWPHIKHDWVFSDIDKLNVNDKIILYFNNRVYVYIVKVKSIIQRGQEVGLDGLNPNSNVLTLVSCWPPGKDYKRIAVQAELQQ